VLGVPLIMVPDRWDAELFPDLGSHDGLFWQLAQGNEFMSSHENMRDNFSSMFVRWLQFWT
jgi:hypothetical protein